MRARLDADTLVVVRILKGGELSCSFPCKKCQRVIRDAGVKRVVYYDWNGDIQELKVG
jgi:deoxycytidylate deaminase